MFVAKEKCIVRSAESVMTGARHVEYRIARRCGAVATRPSVPAAQHTHSGTCGGAALPTALDHADI
jgi:hypothetical protein